MSTLDGPSNQRPADSDAESDLVALGEAARHAQAQMGLPMPAPPWLPMLPAVLDLDRLREARCPSGGRGDRSGRSPASYSARIPLVLDLRGAGHVAVFGAGNSGKTTALTSTALALARSNQPEDDLSIYCLDAASGRLRRCRPCLTAAGL